MKTLELLKLDRQAFLEHLDSLSTDDLVLEYKRMDLIESAADLRDRMNEEEDYADNLQQIVSDLVEAAPENREAIVDSLKAVCEQKGFIYTPDEE